ncbi:MAG: Hpt domain-containing protein [Holophagales bacterium]|jgi:HPt (histidine-containing phosphotransfer) domain-containing protein|nr:Hpt domain-containing protein [Holophagales bacterium]
MASATSKIVSIDELPNVPVLDQPTLDQIKNIDDEELGLIRELFGIFETDMPARLSALKIAIESNNMTKIRELSHAMKGSCGTIGAMRLRAISAMIENHTRENQAEVATLDELFNRLQNAFGEAHEALRKYIEGD